MCVMGIDVTSISTIFRMDYGIVLTMWYCVVFQCITNWFSQWDVDEPFKKREDIK
jgi:hypothetical protein